MKANNTNTLENFQVYVDGELITPTIKERVVSHVEARISHVTANIALQARMALYDARYGTHYRQVRNKLAREKRNREFERAIGLVKIT